MKGRLRKDDGPRTLLRRLLNDADIPVSNFAIDLRLGNSTGCDIVNGRRKVNRSRLQAICDFLITSGVCTDDRFVAMIFKQVGKTKWIARSYVESEQIKTSSIFAS
jgi:hypothetical protein